MHNLEFFSKKSDQLRLDIFKKFCQVGTGHPGSVFSMLDIIVALYYGDYLKFDKSKKVYDDKVIISKGHATSCLYPILVEKGVIEKKDWYNWGVSNDTILRIFGNTSISGIDATSGSLGHGLGIGAGYALSFKKRNLDKKVFVIISEGELYEGSIWETLMFANHQNLNNLHLIIDRNNLMILGDTENCVKLEPIKEKIESFGFETKEVNGHDYSDLLTAYDNFFLNNKNCNCIIANTVKGKGIKQFENNAKWHYWNGLSQDDQDKIIQELSNK